MKYDITVPIRACSVNRYYTVYRGFKNISKEGRAWRQHFLQYVKEYHSDIVCSDKPIKVEFNFGFSYKPQDIDAGIKALQDTLQGIAWADDAQIVEEHIYKYNTDVDFIRIAWEEVE